MDNKKLQEFLKKVEAQSAVARTSALDEINADNGIQTMSETGLEGNIGEEDVEKNVQAIIDNAVEFKKRYRSKDKFVTIFNVDENGVFGNGDFIDFDTDIAVLVDYYELINAYGMDLSEVTSCRLVLFGKTRAWHGCNLYPLDSAKKFCEVVQEDNNVYSIDLKTLYEHKRSADFRLGDPNLMDSFDTDMVKIVINGANMITITDFSRAAVGVEFKDNSAILKSAESFRKNYKFTDGFIKLFDTDGTEIYA